MIIREIIEKAAREAAHGYHDQSAAKHGVIHPLRDHIAATLIAILTDPAVGFKEALECQACKRESSVDDASAAETKLAELAELEKGI